MRQLEGEYDFIYTHFPLYGKKCRLGEIDVMGVKGNSLDVYEVKCSFRKIKAVKQLNRIQRILGVPINKFFYCGLADKVVPIEV